METKIVESKLVGSREKGDLRPIICDNLPRGVDAVVLEYKETTAIVKLVWSFHSLAHKPTDEAIDRMLKHESIVKEHSTHPEAAKLITEFRVLADKVEEKPSNKMKLKHTGQEVSFIRKVRGRHGDEYVFDEG